MQKKYNDLIEELSPRLNQTKQKDNVVGWVRLALILLLVLAVVLSAVVHLLFLILAAAMLVVFVFASIIHHNLHKEISFIKGVIGIYKSHIDRVEHKWGAFKDTGAEFVNTEHNYSCDLDIVGQKSLFQYLNTTNTWQGRKRFAEDLLSAEYSKEEILDRQKAVEELSKDIKRSACIQYRFSEVGVDKNIAAVVDELESSAQFTESKAIIYTFSIMPFIILAAIVLLLVFQPPYYIFFSSVLSVIQIAVWLLASGKTSKYFGAIPNLAHKISVYSEAVNAIISHNFESKKLKELKDSLQSAAKGIYKLGVVSTRINQKRNGIANFLLNFTMWWDFRCAFLLQRWKRQYSGEVKNWFATLGEFESLLSFSHLPNVCKNTCIPVFSNKKAKLYAQELGHPLLANDKRVYNDIDFNDDISIISGSNMSGKTTFLRTIGVNIVLAKAGSFVCGTSCCCSLFDVYTSMRISDNLNEGVSTFYAELKRIKTLLNHAKQKSQILFLIDEIFKGTNSTDRLEGAKAVILKLEKMGASGLISTHDLELCNLEAATNRLRNLSFCEQYKEDKILFDYKLKNRKSTSTNAAYLLKMVGIID